MGAGLILAGAFVHFWTFIFMNALGWSTAREDFPENVLLGLFFASPLYGLGIFLIAPNARR